MRLVLAAALLILAVPPTARAAAFGESPFRAVTGGAFCLHATGLPGELARWTRGGVEVASVGGAVTPVALGSARECPVAVSAPNGFAAVAAATADGVSVAVREPAGGWSAPATFATTGARSVHVSVTARGDVLVVWLGRAEPDATDSPVYAVRRAPGGPFGPRQTLGGPYPAPELAAGLTDDGAAVVAIADREALRVATAAPGAAFGVPGKRARTRSFGGGVALALAGDGRAVLAASTRAGTAVLDRAPGGDFVRRPAVALDADSASRLAVALGPDGGVLLAAVDGGRLTIARRAAGGAFGEPEMVTQPEFNSGDSGAIVSFAYSSGGPPYEGPPALKALLGAGGRALMTWAGDDQAVFATTLDPGASPATVRVGSPLRDPQGLTPLLLAGGSRAIAWTDNSAGLANPSFAGRVHIALEGGAEAPPAAPPAVEVGAPADRTLRPAQSLDLPVRCSAACDLRIETGERVFDPGGSRAGPGTTRLRLFPWAGPIAPARPGPVKLELAWSAPASPAIARRTVTVRLRRAPAPRFPRLLGVRATRGPHGVFDVRWSTDVAAREVGFRVVGDIRRRERAPGDGISFGDANGAGKRRFHVKLTDAARVRYVRVDVVQYFGQRHRRTTVAVR